MNPIPNNLSQDDIGQWLQGGWFLAKANADSAPEPGQLCGVDDVLGWADMEGNQYPLVHDFIFPHWPRCGAVNLDGYAVIVEREQMRQYRRTYNDRCVTLHIPRKWDVMKKFGTAMGSMGCNHPVIVAAVFSPRYYTFSQAIGMIEYDQWLSVALNPHLVIAGADDVYMVYYHNKLIGSIKDGKITPLGTQEGRIRRIIKFFEGRVSL